MPKLPDSRIHSLSSKSVGVPKCAPNTACTQLVILDVEKAME